jgi:hypothetical protein
MMVRVGLSVVIALFLMTASCVSAVSDNFSGTVIDNSLWSVVSGSWSQNNTLSGYWDPASACGIQGRIHLVDSLQSSGDYVMSVDLLNSHGSFSVGYFDSQHVLNIDVDNGGGNPGRIFIERKNSPSCYTIIAVNDSIESNASRANTLMVNKTGRTYAIYFNGFPVLSYEDVLWNGTGKVGLRTYGTEEYDNFFFTPSSVEVTVSEGWNLLSLPLGV